MFKRLFMVLIAAASFAFSPVFGQAQGGFSISDVAEVTVLPGWRMANGNHIAAIRIDLAPGWKTYWRSPGEIGIPPRFSWTGSRNLDSVQIHWPTPNISYTNGFRSIGYSGVTVVPIELTPKGDGQGTIALRGEIEIGVCQEICVPMVVMIRADLAQSGTPDATIQASLAKRPATAAEAGVRSVTCSVEPISDGLRVTALIDLADMGGEEFAIFELPDKSIWIGQSQTSRRGRILSAIVEFVPANGAPFLLNRSKVRITVLGQRGAVDIHGCSAR
jgi:DsbC/DsbD-like thiol-disulfide interchange protein